MTGFPLLSLITFLPLLGALLVLTIRGDEVLVARNARFVALWASGVTFVMSLFLWIGFDTTTAEFQFQDRMEWMPAFNISYHLGVDGISMLFVLLSTLLTPICILASWESI
ncbi:MAG: NADH-quinone oxidoreductase subunit M, partial [Rhodospirillales bacterium]|nr:NADH-quinone oxidoreductase subunit M [Rhodospirillales bacterium]